MTPNDATETSSILLDAVDGADLPETIDPNARLQALADMILAAKDKTGGFQGGAVGYPETPEHFKTHSSVGAVCLQGDGTYSANGWKSKPRGRGWHY